MLFLEPGAIAFSVYTGIGYPDPITEDFVC